MKKKLPLILTFVIGLVLGIVVASWFIVKYSSSTFQIQELANIAELENLSFKIYKDGDPATSVIVIKYLIEKLEMYENNSSNAELYNTDRGIAHGRLCILYEKIGNKTMSENECKIAISLLGSKYKISTQKDLIEKIKKIDSIKMDTKYPRKETRDNNAQ